MRKQLSAATLLALVSTAGCGDSGQSTSSTSSGTGGATSSTAASTSSTASSTSSGMGGAAPKLPPTKLDLILDVENASSMRDAQEVFALALPDLLAGFANPNCLDDKTKQPIASAMQPTSPSASCPTGSTRAFPPIDDIHIGLLSSSLGSFGADGCPDTVITACSGAVTSSENDHGHLLTRTDPCAAGDEATYQNLGFLAWDPSMKLTPPGEAVLGDAMTPGLIKSMVDIVQGEGAIGCGYPSQDESWYRFLIDPTPYATIALNGQNVVASGSDAALLQQRTDFLRPDSVVTVIVVSNKTDASIKESSVYPLFAQELENGQPFHLPTARSECTTKGPNDPCCASCGQQAPTGCSTDPSCTTTPTYTDATENISLRRLGLISHKARYGIEFFNQPSRYVSALTDPTVQSSTGMTVPNPLFINLNPKAYPGAVLRDKSEVYYGAIVGVPWQLIARQTGGGSPDLINGVSALDPTQIGGFKTGAELALKDSNGNTFWNDIVGDPEHYIAAISPYMQESTTPRMGTDPITGTAISPVGSANGTNPINGHEYNIATPAGDIEYACIYPKLSPVDCSQPGAVCDCDGDVALDNPLCDPNPNNGGNPTLQSRAKAYPGIKQLAIAEGLGKNGIAASICASQLTDNTQADYGYRPAMKSILAVVGPRFTTP